MALIAVALVVPALAGGREFKGTITIHYNQVTFVGFGRVASSKGYCAKHRLVDLYSTPSGPRHWTFFKTVSTNKFGHYTWKEPANHSPFGFFQARASEKLFITNHNVCRPIISGAVRGH